MSSDATRATAQFQDLTTVGDGGQAGQIKGEWFKYEWAGVVVLLRPRVAAEEKRDVADGY